IRRDRVDVRRGRHRGDERVRGPGDAATQAAGGSPTSGAQPVLLGPLRNRGRGAGSCASWGDRLEGGDQASRAKRYVEIDALAASTRPFSPKRPFRRIDQPLRAHRRVAGSNANKTLATGSTGIA